MSAAVDIIVRTKDRPVLLERALNSVRAQTFENWRAIIVNDGGSPAEVDLVVEKAHLGDRTKVIHHDVSQGRCASANHGVQQAEAPLIVLHDDDDTWDPKFLEMAVDYLNTHADSPGVVARIGIVWEAIESGVPVEQRREPFQPELTAPFLGDMLLFNRFVPIGFLYRREIHEEIGDYRDDLPVVEDWDFNRRVLTRWPLEFLGDEILAHWHQRLGAEGPVGNSVITEAVSHRHFDFVARDRLLREYVQREGDGHLLYLTKFIDQRAWDLEHHVDDIARAQREHLRLEIESLHQTLRATQLEILAAFERSRSLSSRLSGVWRRLTRNPRD